MEPLMEYSFFLSQCNTYVNSLADEITSELTKIFSDKSPIIDGRVSELSWFWVLGAYEVVRTISSTKDCFSKEFMIEIQKLKKELTVVRIPSAKMEKKGERIPVNSNRCHDCLDFERFDLYIGDPNDCRSIRNLISLYKKILSSLRLEDVLKRHENSDIYILNDIII